MSAIGSAVAPLRCSFLSVCGEEREGGEEMKLGFWMTDVAEGFYSAEIVARPSDRDERLWALGLDSAQAGSRIPGPGSGCGLGVGERRAAQAF